MRSLRSREPRPGARRPRGPPRAHAGPAARQAAAQRSASAVFRRRIERALVFQGGIAWVGSGRRAISEPSFEDEEKKSGHIKSSKAVAAKTSWRSFQLRKPLFIYIFLTLDVCHTITFSPFRCSAFPYYWRASYATAQATRTPSISRRPRRRRSRQTERRQRQRRARQHHRAQRGASTRLRTAGASASGDSSQTHPSASASDETASRAPPRGSARRASARRADTWLALKPAGAIARVVESVRASAAYNRAPRAHPALPRV